MAPGEANAFEYHWRYRRFNEGFLLRRLHFALRR